MHRILSARKSAVGAVLAVLVGVGLLGARGAEMRGQFNPADVQASATASVGIAFQNRDSETVEALGDTTPQATAALSVGDTDASALAWVDDGVIKLQMGVMGPGFPDALLEGAFGDAFLVTSATLPAGTTVEFRVELGFSRTLNVFQPCLSEGAEAYAVLRGAIDLVSATDHTCDLQDDLPASFEVIIQRQVGERFPLFIQARLMGLSGNGSGVSGSVAVRMYVTPLGEADYITASGNDYRRPVDGDEPTVEELLEDLVETVASLNLQAGISNALDAKLDAARDALADVNANNDVAAINSLHALINHIEAQRGKKLTDEQADRLIAATLAIIDAIQSGD